MQIKNFQKKIWEFYKKNKRNFPWRETTNPYHILISEVMLQQTQTYRVLPKYNEWIRQFPDFQTLANAPFAEVLKYWSGLGYNRRALYIHQTAKRVVKEFDRKPPMDPEILQTFPGIGKNTAGSIYVFSANKPHVFIETNIRRVFIHQFGNVILASGTRPESDPGQARMTIHDNQLLPLIEKTLDQQNPRQWYYALMDYGAYLAKAQTNPNRRSRHYTKQSQFEGSLRQVRGKILKVLLAKKLLAKQDLVEHSGDEHLTEIALLQLEKEGFLTVDGNILSLR